MASMTLSLAYPSRLGQKNCSATDMASTGFICSGQDLGQNFQDRLPPWCRNNDVLTQGMGADANKNPPGGVRGGASTGDGARGNSGGQNQGGGAQDQTIGNALGSITGNSTGGVADFLNNHSEAEIKNMGCGSNFKASDLISGAMGTMGGRCSMRGASQHQNSALGKEGNCLMQHAGALKQQHQLNAAWQATYGYPYDAGSCSNPFAEGGAHVMVHGALEGAAFGLELAEATVAAAAVGLVAGALTVAAAAQSVYEAGNMSNMAHEHGNCMTNANCRMSGDTEVWDPGHEPAATTPPAATTSPEPKPATSTGGETVGHNVDPGPEGSCSGPAEQALRECMEDGNGGVPEGAWNGPMGATDPGPDQADGSIPGSMQQLASCDDTRGGYDDPQAARNIFRFLCKYDPWAANPGEGNLSCPASEQSGGGRGTDYNGPAGATDHDPNQPEGEIAANCAFNLSPPPLTICGSSPPPVPGGPGGGPDPGGSRNPSVDRDSYDNP